MVFWPGYDELDWFYGLHLDKAKLIKWHEHDILKYASLFSIDGISYFDVKYPYQVDYNDYLGSAMVATAVRNNDLIRSAFVNQEKNKEGIYGIRFYIKGKPWIVTIDDSFLTEPVSGYLH